MMQLHRMFLLGVLAACGGGKDGTTAGAGTVPLDCDGAACFANLKTDLPKFAPNDGKGAYFAKAKSSSMLLQIVDSKSDQSLSLETKKPVTAGTTYSLGGTSDQTTDFQLGSFS